MPDAQDAKEKEAMTAPEKVTPLPCPTHGETGCCVLGHNMRDTPLNIHPNRLAAEGLVKASELGEVVKALENLGRCTDCWGARVDPHGHPCPKCDGTGVKKSAQPALAKLRAMVEPKEER